MKKINSPATILSYIFACTLSSCALAGTATITYTYDELGRLKSAKTSDFQGQEYEYDAADNRTKKVSLYSPITLNSKLVKSTLSNGTARYKLKADGTIEITKTMSYNYGGQTVYYDVATIDGRWLEAGLSSSAFTVDASLQPYYGDTSCTSGTYYSNIPAHYEPTWTLAAATGYAVRSCTISIKIRATGISTVLGSALITLRAGPNS